MINDNEILLSRSMQLLRQLIIDINENIGSAHIPVDMQMRINNASNIIDDYYMISLEKEKNNIILKKLKELSQSAIPWKKKQ